MTADALLDHAIWWHVYPLGALGAPIRPQEPVTEVTHRLPGLVPWLDHALGLGCSGILLGPVFASVSHGYDTLDHYRIDPRLGDDGDVDALVSACRERGLSLMLDGVFNHVSEHHPLVAEALEHGTGMVKLGPDGRPRGWEGHGQLVELDHSSPATRDLVADVMLHWLRRGIAGWRLDVAYAVPGDFWRDVLARVRAEFPDALFVGEVIHGDYAAIAAEGTLDSVTQYELWKGIWSSLKDRNFWELAHALERHEDFSRTLVTQTFIGNHDVDRIASLVGPDEAVLALVVLMTVPGMPSVYYGDEQAFTGARWSGVSTDDPVRPPLPESPEQLATVGAWMERLYRELIGLRRRHPWLVRSHLEVVARTNEQITYRAAADGRVVQVELDVTGSPAARVFADGVIAVEWSATP